MPGARKAPLQAARYDADPAALQPGPRQAHDTIVARRGSFSPPYRVLIESPDVALAVEHLSSLLWAGSLPPSTLEAVFLVVARRLRCTEQWRRHEVKALAAGVTPLEVEAISKGLPPAGAPGTRAACVIAKRLLAGQRIGRDLWADAQRWLGKRGLAELCAFVGVASIVAASINLQDIEAS
jgi:alkylhydroperoxidase/carboxymuconolactone decarboxylase family protein YurZ